MQKNNRPSEVFTEKDLYVIKHKFKTEKINGVICPYFLSRYNGGIFRDMNYPSPRLSLTRFKRNKSILLTFETEEAANQYLLDNKKYTDINQLEVVLRISPEEAASLKEKRAKIKKKVKESKLANQSDKLNKLSKINEKK